MGAAGIRRRAGRPDAGARQPGLPGRRTRARARALRRGRDLPRRRIPRQLAAGDPGPGARSAAPAARGDPGGRVGPLLRVGRRREAAGGRSGEPGADPVHLGHDRPPQGRRAHPPGADQQRPPGRRGHRHAGRGSRGKPDAAVPHRGLRAAHPRPGADPRHARAHAPLRSRAGARAHRDLPRRLDRRRADHADRAARSSWPRPARPVLPAVRAQRRRDGAGRTGAPGRGGLRGAVRDHLRADRVRAAPSP